MVFPKYAVDANLFRLWFSIQKHEGPRGAVAVVGMGSEAPQQKKIVWQFYKLSVFPSVNLSKKIGRFILFLTYLQID